MTSRMVGSVLTLVILLSSVVGGAAQTYTQIQWGMNKGVTPYAFGANINGTWRDLGTVSSAGVWTINGSNISPQITATNVASTNIGSSVGVYQLTGYSSTGDKGAACNRKRVGATYPFSTQSSDGAYWGLPHDNGASDVACFGAISNAANEVPNIQAALTFVSTSLPGSLLPSGNSTNGFYGAISLPDKDGYRIASAITVPTASSINGCGAGTSTLYTTGFASFALALESESRIDCMIVSSASAVAGSSGIRIGSASSNGQGTVIRDTRVANQDTNILINSGALWHLDHVQVDTFGTYGVKINNLFNSDSGDASITSSALSHSTGQGTSVVRYEGGGGLKFIGNKVIGSKTGFDLSAATTTATVDLMFVGNSVENASVDCMKLGSQDGLTRFSLIAITGNEFGGCGSAGIHIADGVSDAIIGGNVISSLGAGGVAIKIDNGADKINVYNTSVNLNTETVLQDNRTDFSESGIIDLPQKRAFKDITSTTAYTTLWWFSPATFRGTHVTLYFEGVTQGSGSYTWFKELDFRNDGTTTLQNTIQSYSYDDTAGASTPDILVDTTTTAGLAYIKIRKGSGGTSTDGTATLRWDGKIAELHQF